MAPVLNSIAEAYGCNMVEGVMSHQMSQFIIDGNKCILNKPGPEAKVEDVEFEENEVSHVHTHTHTHTQAHAGKRTHSHDCLWRGRGSKLSVSNLLMRACV